MRIRQIRGRGVGAATVLLVTSGLLISPALSTSASADSVEVLSSYSASMVSGLSAVMSGTPDDAAYDSANNTIYVTGWDATNGSEIVPIDTTTNTAGTPILLGSADSTGNPQGPIAIDAAGGRAFVPMNDGVLVVVDLAGTPTVTAVPLSYQSTQVNPQSIAWNAANATLYLSDPSYPQIANHAIVFAMTFPQSGPTLAPVSIAAPETLPPLGLSADSTNNVTYGFGAEGLDVINGANNAATFAASPGTGPQSGTGDMGVQADPTNGRAYYGFLQADGTEDLGYYANGTNTDTGAQIEAASPNGSLDEASALDPGYAYFAFDNPDNGQFQPAGSSIRPVDLSRDVALPAISIGAHVSYGGTVDTQNHVAYVAADDGVHVLTPHYQTQTVSNPTITHLTATRFASGATTTTVHPGDAVTFSAQVQGATLNSDPGLVDFWNLRTLTALSGCQGRHLNASATATCTMHWNKVGTYTVFASYRDDWGPDARSTSRQLTVKVVPFNTTVSLNPSTWRPRRDALVTFSGRIGPARRATATLQQLIGRTWHRVAHVSVAGIGRYAMRARVRSTSSWRVVVTGDATHRTGTSRSIRLRVR